MRKWFAFFCLLFLLMPACQKMPVFFAEPETGVFENSVFKATLTPVKEGEAFFWFNFFLENKSEKKIEINWNKTQYIFDNKDYGIFLFEGIEPETIKNRTIPVDSVLPGETFEKQIAPAKLAARIVLRTDRPRGKTVRPGPIPAGMNGMQLVVNIDGNTVTKDIGINITEN